MPRRRHRELIADLLLVAFALLLVLAVVHRAQTVGTAVHNHHRHHAAVRMRL